MGAASITVEQLAKRYRLGSFEFGYRTLRDVFSRARRQQAQHANEIYALRDVNLEVEQGEAVGLIGHNGAGKSTLLKILSRITEPTSGRAVLHGRVASLLEVGTGFHPELTGRENIYLNGAILGMRRSEIRRDFDNIVQFAEVERFLDTPVKRYSSGMYVRLGFAIAAYLTPEILLVDEVLSVGDVDFQRRCLGRMNEVARSGRTVIFVSHSLSSIERLCTRTVLMRQGTVAKFGPTREVIAYYMSAREGASAFDVGGIEDRSGTGRARIMRLEVLSEDGATTLDVVPMGTPFRIRIHYVTREPLPQGAGPGLCILTENDERVTFSSAYETNDDVQLPDGTGYADCVIRPLPVLPGTYYLEVWLTDPSDPRVFFADHLRMVGKLQIVAPSDVRYNVADLILPGRGWMFLDCRWEAGRE